MTSRILLLTLVVAGLAAVVDAVRPAGARPRVVMMASTIGPVDAGIVSAREDAYLKRTGVVVRHVGAGTGATQRFGGSS